MASERENRSRYSKVAMYSPLGETSGTAVAGQRRKLRWFKKDGFVNQRLREDAAVDNTGTAYFVPRLYAQVASSVTLNTFSFVSPIYEAPIPPLQHLISVTDTDAYMNGTNSPYKWGPNADIPWEQGWRSGDAEIAMTTYKDRHALIHDPSSDTLWEFFGVQQNASNPPHNWPTVVASHGGKATDLSEFSGAFPTPFGATGTSISLGAGQILYDECALGVIPHILKMAVALGTPYERLPATRGDQPGGANDVPEGSIFRLPYDFDPEAYAAANSLVSPLAKMCMYAMRDYGVVASDASSGVVTLYAEDMRREEWDYGSFSTWWDRFLINPTSGKAITAVASTDVFTSTSHGLANGTKIFLTDLVGGTGTPYLGNISWYMGNVTTHTFKLYSDVGLTAVCNLASDISAGTLYTTQTTFNAFKVDRFPWNLLIMLPETAG